MIGNELVVHHPEHGKTPAERPAAVGDTAEHVSAFLDAVDERQRVVQSREHLGALVVQEGGFDVLGQRHVEGDDEFGHTFEQVAIDCARAAAGLANRAFPAVHRGLEAHFTAGVGDLTENLGGIGVFFQEGGIAQNPVPINEEILLPGLLGGVLEEAQSTNAVKDVLEIDTVGSFDDRRPGHRRRHSSCGR